MQHLTREELKALLREIPDDRQRLMILTGFWHGLRVSELINLLPTNMRDGYVDVQRRKGSLRTIQPFISHEDPDLDEASALRKLLPKLGPEDRLFPMTRDGVLKLMKRAGKRAGLPEHKLHPHILKHSIAMQTISEGGIEYVRKWLGHKSISSTGEYLKVDDDAAAKAIMGAMGAVVGG